jgi:hypothetical protein
MAGHRSGRGEVRGTAEVNEHFMVPSRLGQIIDIIGTHMEDLRFEFWRVNLAGGLIETLPKARNPASQRIIVRIPWRFEFVNLLPAN